MENIRDNFYNFFWQNKHCRQLFLLSKEELLDSHRFDLENESFSFSFSRIILSNLDDDQHAKEKQLLRTHKHAQVAEQFINSKIELYKPHFQELIFTKFGDSITRLISDWENNRMKFVRLFIRLVISDNTKKESLFIDFLHEYNFIGKHIKSLSDLGLFLQKEAIEKSMKPYVNEQNVNLMLDIFKSIKDTYWTLTLRMMEGSNQILVNALHEKEKFEDRLHLFDLLYDQGLIKPSSRESFIQCQDCPPDTYNGMFHLKIRPKHTARLICPICSEKLKYYIPYDIDPVLFTLIKNQDGLILDALAYLCEQTGLKHMLHIKELNDIELDCIIIHKRQRLVVETKMYALEKDERKLVIKVKRHAGHLYKAVSRIIKEKNVHTDKVIIRPILLVNITNDELLASIKAQITDPVEVYNLDQIKEVIEQLPR